MSFVSAAVMPSCDAGGIGGTIESNTFPLDRRRFAVLRAGFGVPDEVENREELGAARRASTLSDQGLGAVETAPTLGDSATGLVPFPL